MEYQFRGTHIISEFYGIEREKFECIEGIEQSLMHGIIASGASLVHLSTIMFEQEGFTTYAILKESHTTFHAYPENGTIFADAFTCGDCDPNCIVESMRIYFEPRVVKTQTIHRGTK